MNPALNIATNAARNAARIINYASNNRSNIRVERKGRKDFVTEVDRNAESEIISTIKKHYPHHSILAEESGEKLSDLNNSNNQYKWIIDPLDGTTNFIHGFPQYAVSIGFYQNGVGEVGVIYDPGRNELFTAVRGSGSMLDQKRIRVSSQANLADALIGTGFPFRNTTHLKQYIKQMEVVMKGSAGIRRAGSAALDLAYLAAGRLDGFWEYNLSLWDIAAGVLIIKEAGGIVSEPDGNKKYIDSGNVLAANAKLHEQLIDILNC